MNSIKIATRDEIFLIDLRLVAYFKADGHYTNVCFLSGSKLFVPCGLSKIFEKIVAINEMHGKYVLMGRSLLVNRTEICCLNPIIEIVLIHGNNGQMLSIHVPKSVLRKIMPDF